MRGRGLLRVARCFPIPLGGNMVIVHVIFFYLLILKNQFMNLPGKIIDYFLLVFVYLYTGIRYLFEREQAIADLQSVLFFRSLSFSAASK